MTIAGVIFSALAVALVGGVHTAILSQQDQQAGDLLNQAVERSRALGYDALTMRDDDVNAGEVNPATGTGARTPALTSCTCYNPQADSASGTELLAHDPAGGLAPHVTKPVQNGLTYTLRQYVTLPADSYHATYKRLTAVVSWSSGGKRRTRTYSTFVTSSKRGLPLPDFTLTGNGPLSQCRNPGSDAVYSVRLKNNGARDAWQVTADPAAAGWQFYTDSNGSGDYDSDDAELPNDAAGVRTTGPIETTRSLTFYAVWTLPAAVIRPPTYTAAMTLRATSTAVPSVYKELATATLVQANPCGGVPSGGPPPADTTSTSTAPAQPPAPCTPALNSVSPSAPGGTAVRYYLSNPGQPGNTPAAVEMPVAKDVGTPLTATTLYAYSQDLTAAAGRSLDNSAVGTARSTASWNYQVPAASTLKGNGTLTLYAAPTSGLATATPAFTVKLELITAAGATMLASSTFTTPATGWGCTGFRAFTVPLNLPSGATAVAANQHLRVTVTTANPEPVMLAYGTSTFPSALVLPYRTGLG